LTVLLEPLQLKHIHQIIMGCTTCLVTYGNGVQIGLQTHIPLDLLNRILAAPSQVPTRL